MRIFFDPATDLDCPGGIDPHRACAVAGGDEPPGLLECMTPAVAGSLPASVPGGLQDHLRCCLLDEPGGGGMVRPVVRQLHDVSRRLDTAPAQCREPGRLDVAGHQYASAGRLNADDHGPVVNPFEDVGATRMQPAPLRRAEDAYSAGRDDFDLDAASCEPLDHERNT